MAKRNDHSSPQGKAPQDDEAPILHLSYFGAAVALVIIAVWVFILAALLNFASIDSECLGGLSSRGGRALELVVCAPTAGLKGWAVMGWMLSPLALLRILIVRAAKKKARAISKETSKG